MDFLKKTLSLVVLTSVAECESTMAHISTVSARGSYVTSHSGLHHPWQMHLPAFSKHTDTEREREREKEREKER